MFNRPQFYKVTLHAIMATLLGLGAWFFGPDHPVIGMFFAAFALLFTGLGIAYALWFFVETAHAMRVREIEALHNTERVQIIRYFCQMSPEQLDAWINTPMPKSILSGIEPRTVKIEGMTMDLLWFRDFTEDDVFLKNIGDYSEGSNKRMWAQYLVQKDTGVWTQLGYVHPALGNMRAAWVNKRLAMEMVEE